MRILRQNATTKRDIAWSASHGHALPQPAAAAPPIAPALPFSSPAGSSSQWTSFDADITAPPALHGFHVAFTAGLAKCFAGTASSYELESHPVCSSLWMECSLVMLLSMLATPNARSQRLAEICKDSLHSSLQDARRCGGVLDAPHSRAPSGPESVDRSLRTACV